MAELNMKIFSSIAFKKTLKAGSLTSHRVKASTLIEVIISLVIIMIVFVMAIGIFTKITQSGMSVSSVIARNKLNDMLQEAIKTGNYEELSIMEDSISYKQNPEDYPGYPDLLIIKLEAVQNGKLISKMQQIVKKDTDEE